MPFRQQSVRGKSDRVLYPGDMAPSLPSAVVLLFCVTLAPCVHGMFYFFPPMYLFNLLLRIVPVYIPCLAYFQVQRIKANCLTSVSHRLLTKLAKKIGCDGSGVVSSSFGGFLTPFPRTKQFLFDFEQFYGVSEVDHCRLLTAK